VTDPWYVYILQATSRKGRITVHVGVAKNVSKRIQEHRKNKVKATRGKHIKLLGHSEEKTQGDALRDEMRLKKLTRATKLQTARRWNSRKRV
jgi:predicted GIY-YIG superfamily endonuclease